MVSYKSSVGTWWLVVSQLHSVCFVMTTRMVMEEKTKIGATKSKKIGWRLPILFCWIIGLSPPIASYPIFCVGRSLGVRLPPPPNTHTHLSTVLNPPSFLSPSHFHISCEYLLFDYLLSNAKGAAAVTLASLSGTLSRLRSYSISGLNQCICISTICTLSMLQITCVNRNFLVRIPAHVSQRVVWVHA